MMCILAEISDKMPSMALVWGLRGVLCVLAAVGLFRRALAGKVLAVCALVSGLLCYAFCHEAFWEGEFSRGVREEMGAGWIVQAIASAFLPVGAAFVVYLWVRWSKRGCEAD